MIYPNIRSAVFLKRPNRFIAEIEVDGKPEICHVKNTGRCRELLIPDAKVQIQEFASLSRKTKYDLIAVWKGDRLINIDSNAPNKVFAEWVRTSGFFQNITLLKPEQRYGSSRFDFYLEADGQCVFVEVKGVTLEEQGVVRFPDAPTERGVKHLHELAACVEAGFAAYVVFVIQMKGVDYMEPNWKMDPAFGEALRSAKEKGVQVLAVDCHVTENSMRIADFVHVHI